MNKRKPKHRKIYDGVEILYRMYIKGNPKAEEQVKFYLLQFDIAQQIYDLRMAAELTQGQLAKLVGTTTSVISRLEDADYEGHSLSMLRRIASAFNRRVEVRFVPLSQKAKRASVS